ncbi:MAG: FtsW/RodA/SpoVE family cell cycle protein [Anaerolineae bacterium]|nr:MAG: FtsW/RodA/SpoVE family cell cycle protein [Anaerolineae bacterium]
MKISSLGTKYLQEFGGGSSNPIFEILLILIASVFVFSNSFALNIIDGNGQLLQHLFVPIAWFIGVMLVFWLINKFAKSHDRYLIPIIALLAGWGLILISRLAENFLYRQLLWLGIGLMLITVITLVPRNLRWLRHYRYTLLAFGLLLLLATILFGVNPSGSGAALWLKVPFAGHVYFQPSELLKVILVIFLASYFDEREPIRGFKFFKSKSPLGSQAANLLPLFLMWGFSLLILIWQRDLGTATIFFIVFLALLYLATGSRRMIAAGLSLLLVAAIIAYAIFDVVSLRIDTWIDPWSEATGRGFQIVQSLYSLASGGIFGQGVGLGSPTYIPVVHTDFAFAAVGEEWGLIGGLTVVALFAVLAYRGFRIAAQSKRPFRIYLAAGLAIMFSVQSLLIMGGVTKVLPLTGVTLPFVSYGGSSMVISSIMVGLLLNMSRYPDNNISYRE